jgi:transcriptional regulator with XRE-family HTH domain
MKVPATFLSDIERGVRNPSWSTILSLSKALGVKPSEIVKRAE